MGKMFAYFNFGLELGNLWASLVAQLIKNLPACRRPGFNLWVGKIPWKKERLLTPVFWPGEFHGLYSPWSHKESDTTEWLALSCPVKIGGQHYWTSNL